jgi:two-component system response regulator AtoC
MRRLDRLHREHGPVKKILVVDDEENYCSLVCRILSYAGFQTVAAVNGKDAILLVKEALLRDQRFDLIITDIWMPGISGVELIEELQKDGVGVPVIVMSGGFEDGLLQRLSQHGCSVFLAKPFEKKDLLDAIDAGMKNQ